MSDDQLEQVFAKMRKSLGDIQQNDMLSALEEARAKMKAEGAAK